MSSDAEIWKQVNDYEGIYEVSNFGRVKSLKYNKVRLLNLQRDTLGYLMIVLYKNKCKRTMKVHRLIANAFIPNIDNKPDVSHKNGIKHDNIVSNLEWCTKSENTQHSYDTGLQPIRSGTDIYNAKFNNADIIKIREIGKSIPYKATAKVYGVYFSTIEKIVNRKSWNHI